MAFNFTIIVLVSRNGNSKPNHVSNSIQNNSNVIKVSLHKPLKNAESRQLIQWNSQQLIQTPTKKTKLLPRSQPKTRPKGNGKTK